MREKVAAHPSPRGDWASNPTSGSSASNRKWRTSSQRCPSRATWKATARPIRATRSSAALPSTTTELQSSEVPRVTTETIIASPSGEYSRQSFAQVRSSCQSTSAPASNVDANATSSSAARTKSPRTAPTSAGAVRFTASVRGSTNQSVRGPARMRSVSSPTLLSTGAWSQWSSESLRSGDGFCLFPRQAPRDDLRDAVAAHRDAVQHVGGFHRALLVRDHDELRAIRVLPQERDEAADVRVVERRLDLVEQIERTRARQEEREQERDRAERLLAAGKQREPLHLLARRTQ